MAEAHTVCVVVHPGARRERVVPGRSGVLDIYVREKAERGEANQRVRELVALHEGVPLAAVRLSSGARGPSKKFSVVRY